jgi:3-hydroxymyristoyl/3-hydroxydecanoyl-(acyl carrier protein) dehydratase
MVASLIVKEDTFMRNAIPANQRLSATLRFLATAQAFEDLKFTTAIAPQTLSRLVLETCKAIIWALKNNIKVRNSPVHSKTIY